METSLSSQPAESQAAIPLNLIYASPHQLRHQFDEEALDDLARSMKEEGLIQPVVLRKVGSAYELVAGERRFRAAEKLGWKTIEARVISATDESAAVKGLIENLQRANLKPLEEAKGYRQLMDAPYNLSCEDIARRVGKTPASIGRLLALLDPAVKRPSPEPDPLEKAWSKGLCKDSRVRYKGKGRWQLTLRVDPTQARESLGDMLIRLGKALQKAK